MSRRAPDVEITHREVDPGREAAAWPGSSADDAAAVLVAMNTLVELGRAAPRSACTGRRTRQRRSVRPARQAPRRGTGRRRPGHRAGHASTFHWVLAFGESGLSTAAVYNEIDRLQETGEPPRLEDPEPLLGALASGDVPELAPAAGQRSAAGLAGASTRTCARTLRAGTDAGALAGIVSGSGPTCAFLCASSAAALDVGTELAGRGRLPHRPGGQRARSRGACGRPD